LKPAVVRAQTTHSALLECLEDPNPMCPLRGPLDRGARDRLALELRVGLED